MLNFVYVEEGEGKLDLEIESCYIDSLLPIEAQFFILLRILRIKIQIIIKNGELYIHLVTNWFFFSP